MNLHIDRKFMWFEPFIYCQASLWAFCSKVFKGIPLNVIHLDWLAACNSIGLAYLIVVVCIYFVFSRICFIVVLFFFGGRIPHPSLVLSFLSIYAFVVSYQKNISFDPGARQTLPN